MRHWFKKTGENTIELKEKRWAAVKIVLIIFTVIAVYYNFIDPRYQNMTKTHIYTALLMGSRFFIHRRAFVKLHGRCKYSAQQKKSAHEKPWAGFVL